MFHQFQVWFLPVLILALTTALAIPLSRYCAWIMNGKYRAPAFLRWSESLCDTGPQNWKQYAFALMLFNLVMFVFGFIVLANQPSFPFNPDNKPMVAPTTIFNTTCSFLTNTNLQHYSGEQTPFLLQPDLLHLLEHVPLGKRGLLCPLGHHPRPARRRPHGQLLRRHVARRGLHVPAGQPDDGRHPPGRRRAHDAERAANVATVEPDDGQGRQGQQTQQIARGPVAAIIPIKHLGTNGGGFFGANSAHPFENPSAWSNFLTVMNMCLFPFTLVLMFGRMLKQMRHAWVIFGVMMSLMIVMIAWAVGWDTLQPNPALQAHDDLIYAQDFPQPDGTVQHKWVIARSGSGAELVDRDPQKKETDKPKPGRTPELPVDQSLGNLEGKELRFGTSAGATFAAATTCITCGSVNCMHDSLNPLAGISPMTGMWLNCIFGGKGVGMINMLIYLIVGVFIAGLMVGRTPEYLGKKVEAREMKLAMIALLVHPILILMPTGYFAATDWGLKAMNNPGAHGFSEVLYEFSSASANNGSEFDGLTTAWGSNDPKSPNPPVPQNPALGHRHGPGDALRPVHSR